MPQWWPSAEHPHRIAVLASDVLGRPDGSLEIVQLPPDPSWDELAAAIGIEAPKLAPGDTLPDELGTAQLYWPAVAPGCGIWSDAGPCGRDVVEVLRFCTGERDEHGGIEPLPLCSGHLAEYLADQLLV